MALGHYFSVAGAFGLQCGTCGTNIGSVAAAGPCPGAPQLIQRHPSHSFATKTHSGVLICDHCHCSVGGGLASDPCPVRAVVDEEATPPVSPAPERPRCEECKRELSAYLDAYYGHDFNARNYYCRDCR